MNNAIVVVAYNRIESLKRLFLSLTTANYDESVDLIISIDKSDIQEKVINVAESFKWSYGAKKIKAYKQRLGLKKHILTCGDISKDYDAIIILEDDLTISPNFYKYTIEAIKFYNSNENIAGISLYNYEVTNSYKPRMFCPLNNGYDAYLMQFAQSWGQCWTKAMWKSFRQWYNNNSGEIKDDEKLPAIVVKWNEKSWLKYYMKYIVDTNKFFVYPYYSFTTNHSEAGQHRNETTSDYQVNMLYGNKTYKFPDFDEAIKYDVFFERVNFAMPKYENKNICLDLYGNKMKFDDYDILFSTKSRPYKVIDKIALTYRPHELNCVYQEKGEGIFVYDLKKKAKPPKCNNIIAIRYDLRAIHWKKTLLHGFIGLFNAISIRLKSVIRRK